jgi:hypothetical protein
MKDISAAGRQDLKGGMIKCNKFLQLVPACDNNHCLLANTWLPL